ncbi:hypothetical protein EC968_009526 [Mortierella alpina]|nr:hypothetical protein EC968_009526 [Mortierella alpina]
MVKILFLQSAALLASLSVVLGCYSEVTYRDKNRQVHYIANYGCSRQCACVKNVNTKTIYKGVSASTKVFKSSDCTGAYSEVKGSITNAEWAGSISFGPKGNSKGPYGCPRNYPV